MDITTSTLDFDAVIVLANLMSVDGELNEESKARAESAIKIYSKSNARNIVTCGWAYRPDSNIPIAEAFKSYIVTNSDICPSKVITELNSRDTVGDAFFTKANLALVFGWKKIAVVTSQYHVDRTLEIFRFMYGPEFEISVQGADAQYSDAIVKNEAHSTDAFRKTFSGVAAGDDVEILGRLRTLHPFYNGDIYPKI